MYAWMDRAEKQSRSQWLHKLLTELLFLCSNTWFVNTLRMNILTFAKLKIAEKFDDSAEFQIVPKISNQISILYSIELSFLSSIEFFNRVELQICRYNIIHKNIVDGFSRFQRFVEPAE
jgi:hypothetical protein